MSAQIKQYSLIGLFLFFVNVLFAQNLAVYEFTISKNSVLNVDMVSSGPPVIAQNPASANNGTLITVSPLFPGYNVAYEPHSDFTGSESFVVEYYVPGQFPGIYTPKYSTVLVHVVQSIVTCEMDYVSLDDLTPDMDVDVLSNDFTDLGALGIPHISQEFNCTASVNSDSTLHVSITPGFHGMAYVKYAVTNDHDGRDEGLLVIKVNNGNINVNDTLVFYTSEKRELELLFIEDGYDLAAGESLNFGDLFVEDSDRLKYVPNTSGIEEFVLTNGTQEKLIQIHNLATGDSDLVTVDDNYAMAPNQTIVMDVTGNDHRTHQIIDHSPELIKDSQDNLSFTSSTPGVFEFYYTVNIGNGSGYHTSTITIEVSDFNPETNEWELTTPRNVSRLVEYNVPMDDYEMNAISNPLHGTLEIYHGLDTVDLTCTSVVGRELIIYTPNTNYLGVDYFEVEYCPGSSPCEILKFDIEVFNHGNDSLCHCVQDCVWPGDTNNDGRVSIADVLPIGLYMGCSGPSRSDEAYNLWYGQNSASWNAPVLSQEDLKYVDADGDGQISEADLSVVLNNLGGQHNVTSYEPSGIKGFYFNLIPHSTELDSGDLAVFDIVIGNYEYPVFDLNGLSFSIGMNPAMVDSASLNVDFFEQDWFTYLSPSVQSFVSPEDGMMQAAFARSKGIPVSGLGVIGEVSFIVEDGVDGFKVEDGQSLIPIPITIYDIRGLSDTGESLAFANAETVVYLKLPTESHDTENNLNLLTFPNPTNNLLNVHLNGSGSINSYRIFDVYGKEVLNGNNVNAKNLQVNTVAFISGTYTIQVLSDLGQISSSLFTVIK